MTTAPESLMNPTETRVLAALDTDAMLQTLADLVAIPSLDGSPEEVAIQQHLADWMRAHGFEVDQWEIDLATLRQHSQYSDEVERPRALGVVGSIGEDRGGRSLILNGHTDVVPAGDLANWPYPAFQTTLAAGKVYGRGALDMKGGLVCGLFAALAIQQAGVKLRGRLMVMPVSGEEDGGFGALAAVTRGYRADGAIIMEPTELAVAPAQAGAQNFRLTVPGLAAHGCVREEGVSAIEKFFPLYAAIMALEAARNARHREGPFAALYTRYTLPYPICIGNVRAGTWASSVAESLVAEGRYGVAVGEDVAAARRELEQCVAQAAAADPWLSEHPPQLEWWGGQFDPASTPLDAPIVGVVQEAYLAVNGTPTHLEGMTYGADMRLLVNVGQTPTVMFGPGDVRLAHRPDESVPLADLISVARTIAVAALRFCGYD